MGPDYTDPFSQIKYTTKILEFNAVRNDGQPDTGGNPLGEPFTTTTAPNYPRLDNAPFNFKNPFDFTRPNELPDTLNPAPDIEPTSEPETKTDDDSGKNRTVPDSPTSPDAPKSPDDLPTPKDKEPDIDPDFDPNPEDEKCCPATVDMLQDILDKLSSEYEGEIDIAACGEEDGFIQWRGTGVDGVMEAILALQEQLEIVHENTKCGPEPQPLPMLWEVKSGQVPQLAIVWQREEGGSSRWSMHVPHPKPSVGPGTKLEIPNYVKGSLMATLKLSDNSKVIVNALDKAQAEIILSYLRAEVIDPDYLEGSKTIYTEGAANRAITTVNAVHVSAYCNQKEAPPLWARSLS